MPELIIWKRGKYSITRGYVNQCKQNLFAISLRPVRCEEKWKLTCELPGMISRTDTNENQDILKACAEEWLREFATSIGATMREDPRG